MVNRKKSTAKLLSLVLAGAMAFSAPQVNVQAAPSNGNAMQLYVSADGKTDAAGTLEDPLGSLEDARDKIRSIKKSGGLPQGGIVVNLRGGTYQRVEDSFRLEEQDSGTSQSPVIYRAYEGEEVELVGNMIVKGEKFAPVTEEEIRKRLPGEAADKVMVYDLKKENGIEYFAPIPKNGFGWPAQSASMSVLVDGDTQTLSRYPNTGWINISSIQSAGFIPRNHLANPDGTCPECTKTGGGTRIPCKIGENRFLEQPGGKFTVNNADIKAKYPLWSQESDIWTMGYFCWDWADDNCAIGELLETANGVSMTMRHPSRYGVVGIGRKFFAYNMLCEIDQPGEWYLDRETGKLYLYPKKDISASDVELTIQSNPIIQMNNVSNVEIQDISISKANGYGIVMTDCENVEIAGCDFADLGLRAVYMGNPEDPDVNTGAGGGSNNTVRSCNIVRMGQGGVFMGGGNRYTLTPGNNKVTNCDISDFAVVKRTYSPAVEAVGCGNIVERNEIYNAPHTAIMFSGNDMKIYGNDIHNVCYETADVGAVYSVRRWSYQGVEVKNNFIHDLVNTGGLGSAAVYVDDLGSGVTMTENLLVNIPGYTTLFGGGRDNVITNNIQINSGNGKGFQYDNRGQGWAWYHSAGPDGECYAELQALRANADYDKALWDERFPSLAQIDLTNYDIKTTEKGEGFKYYYKNAAKPANATIQDNILVGVSNPFGNVNGTVKELGTFENNNAYPQGQDIGFANAEAYDFTVLEDSLIKTTMGDDHFKAEDMGLYEDEYRTLEKNHLEKPVLLTPMDNETDITVQNGVRFSWKEVEGAGSYTLEIAADKEFTDIVKKASVDTPSATIMGLDISTSYHWRVTARERVINGAFRVSDSRSFTTSDKEDTSFFEGFRSMDAWTPEKGTPENTDLKAHSGRYSYILNEGMDVIKKEFGTQHNDVVTLWMYDNMLKEPGTAALANVTREVNGGNVWVSVGIKIDIKGVGKDTYAYRAGNTVQYSDIQRTEGWHKLTWDYTDGKSCIISIDDQVVLTVEDAPYYDRILIGDFWSESPYAGNISNIMFDDLTIGEPNIKENVLSITLPEESIKIPLGETYQLKLVVETDPDVDAEIEYVNGEYEIARVNESGLIEAMREGTTQVTVCSVKDPAVKAVVNIEVTEVNKSELAELYGTLMGYAKVNHTPESWDVLAKALVKAYGELHRGSTPESVKDAISSLESARSGLVFHENLAGEDQGFEAGGFGVFEQYPENGDTSLTKEISSEEKHSGSYSAKITAADMGYKNDKSTNAIKGLLYTVPQDELTAGAQYDVSFWVKSGDNKEHQMGIKTIFGNEGEEQDSKWITAGNTWTFVTCRTTAVPNGTDKLKIVMGNQDLAGNGGIYYIDDVVVAKAAAQIPVTGVTLDQEMATVSQGDSVILNAVVSPDNATNDTVNWTSSDSSVAVVENGTVTAIAPGTAEITVMALDGEFTASFSITVPVLVTGVELSSDNVTSAPGKNFILQAVVKPENATNKKVSFSSSDTNVATVDETGTVTTVSTGDAVITVTTQEGSFTDDCTVRVQEDVAAADAESVYLSETEKSLMEGEKFTLTATVSPGDADQTVTWSSSDINVATVRNGEVTAVKEGEAVISVTTVDAGLTADCHVKVGKAPTEPPIDPDQPDIPNPPIDPDQPDIPNPPDDPDQPVTPNPPDDPDQPADPNPPVKPDPPEDQTYGDKFPEKDKPVIKSPKTGEECSNVKGMAFLFILSAGGCGILLKRYHKKKQNK